ncbi:MAG TPA: DUF1697 domain-containing protein [Gemmatimonadaceae bacterium]
MSPAGRQSARDTQVALLRGVNVGTAKRVPMAGLRSMVEGLGFADVRTLLNSGNVVYTARGVAPTEAAARIEQGLVRRLGVSARVFVYTAREIAEAVSRNPLVDLCDNPSRMFVAFMATPAHGRKLQPLLKQKWEPEQLSVGKRVAWLWCPGGLIDSPLMVPVSKTLGDAVTIRNWATVTKLHAMVTGER